MVEVDVRRVADPAPPAPGAAEAAAPVVALRDVSRWHGEVIAVNDVTVEVAPGVTGLLGPNGAGKTSLLRMLVGLSRPSAGTLRVLGEDPWNNPRLLRRVGYVPEAPPPWRELSARECAERAGRYAGLDPAAARRAADDCLARVGLSGHADRAAGTFSHGMQQRLKFALALLHDPDLLVLDEPLLGTDPLARRDLLRLMQDLAGQGKSLLLSTHILPDVEALTRRILVLHRGRLMAYGEVPRIRDLLEAYPRTVRIATPDPRGLGAALWGWDSVASLQAEGDVLTVRTHRPAEFYAALQDLLARGGHPFTSVTSPDDHVETVFRYLVG